MIALEICHCLGCVRTQCSFLVFTQEVPCVACWLNLVLQIQALGRGGESCKMEASQLRVCGLGGLHGNSASPQATWI